MRMILAALALLLLSVAVEAATPPQTVTVTFSPPVSGGAPTGYRLFKDGTLVGAVTSGQQFAALLPGDGSYLLGVEAFNATGTGPRVNQTVTVGPLVPGPVTNLLITLACATSSPPTCTVTSVAAP